MGIFAPTAVNLAGSERNSRISCSSSIASSQPATSLNVVFGVSLLASLALLLPKPRTRFPPPWTLLNMMKNKMPMIRNGRMLNRNVLQNVGWGLRPFQASRVPAACRAFSRSMISWLWVPTQFARYFRGGSSLVVTWMVCSPSVSTTSASGSLPLISATTSEVGFSV